MLDVVFPFSIRKIGFLLRYFQLWFYTNYTTNYPSTPFSCVCAKDIHKNTHQHKSTEAICVYTPLPVAHDFRQMECVWLLPRH